MIPEAFVGQIPRCVVCLVALHQAFMYHGCVIVRRGTCTKCTGVLSVCYSRTAQSERSTSHHMTCKCWHLVGTIMCTSFDFSICSIRWLHFAACKLQFQAALLAACCVGGQRRRGAHGVQAGAGGGAGVPHLCHEASPPEQAPGSAAAV